MNTSVRLIRNASLAQLIEIFMRISEAVERLTPTKVETCRYRCGRCSNRTLHAFECIAVWKGRRYRRFVCVPCGGSADLNEFSSASTSPATSKAA